MTSHTIVSLALFNFVVILAHNQVQATFSLFSGHRHRAINIFARTYYELWLQDENVGQEIMIEDLTVRILEYGNLNKYAQVQTKNLFSNHSRTPSPRK